MKTATKPIATKFVKWEVGELEMLKNTRTYILCEKVSKGEKLSRAKKKLDNLQTQSQYLF